MNPYETCPSVTTNHLNIRLIKIEDASSLYECYHDRKAVALMNDDNCDFGFYVETPEQMSETVGYWIDFYHKGYFVRFSIEDRATRSAIGTIEGFAGDIGVLRVDIKSDYEKEEYLREIFKFAEDNFKEYFGNTELVTKAVDLAKERRKVLDENGWEFIDMFRNYNGYYKKKL